MKLCPTSAQNHLTNSRSPSIYSAPKASCDLPLYLPLYVSLLFPSSLLYCTLPPLPTFFLSLSPALLPLMQSFPLLHVSGCLAAPSHKL